MVIMRCTNTTESESIQIVYQYQVFLSFTAIIRQSFIDFFMAQIVQYNNTLTDVVNVKL